MTWADTYSTPSISATGTADIDVDDWGQTPINDVVNVYDDQTVAGESNLLGTATWNEDGTPGVFTYTLELEGTAGTCVDYTNNAWIEGAGAEDSSMTTVCMHAPLDVEKSVDASYDRTYEWDIEKSADETELDVDSATGQGTFHYTVEAIPGGYTDRTGPCPERSPSPTRTTLRTSPSTSPIA